MRVLLATIGTRGDVQPYIALALGLREAGHEVAICTCARFRPMLAEWDLPWLPLDEGLLELLDSSAGRAIFSRLDSIAGMLRTVPAVLRQVGPIHRRMVADAWAAVEAFAPDVVVYHPKLFCMPAFAARRGFVAVLALLVPMLVPTGTAPLHGMPRLPLGAGYNRATYRLLQWLMHQGSRPFLRDWRRSHDPAGLARGSAPLRIARDRPLTVIHGYSRHVCAPPADWSPQATVSGWWFLPAHDWTPPDALRDFLAAGPPPVYIGFGSMAGVDPAATTAIVLAAVAQAGVRAVIARGWGGLEAGAGSDRVFLLDAAPHAWLFPRMAAVVHHGGAGTTGAGLRAGLPSVICPFGVDQPFWGERVHALGVGPAPIPQKRLDAARLAAAIIEATTNSSMRDAAQALGAAIRAESGVRDAVATIEACAAARRG
jgi:sterol 3beta-glucosyltransferase